MGCTGQGRSPTVPWTDPRGGGQARSDHNPSGGSGRCALLEIQMLDPDKWYSAREFAGFLGVNEYTIYHSQPQLSFPKLPAPVPEPIRLGNRLRWSGSQIKLYQEQLAQRSGVVLPGKLAQTELPPTQRRSAGRPRRTASATTGGQQ